MHLDFYDIRYDIELMFEQYRKHKYYTLFMNDYNTNVTSQIDEIGGGQSNVTSDKVADHVVKVLNRKQKAVEYVNMIELAVDQLPDIEKELIQLRYMSRNHNYVNDYAVYEIKMHISDKTYRKIREEAFAKLYTMLCSEKIP